MERNTEADRGRLTLEEQEAQVEKRTLASQGGIVGILRGLGSSLIDGFNSVGGQIEIRDDNRLQRAWLLLLAKSMQSWVCAWRLSMKGYYSQSITLLRTMTEDYLVALDCQCTPETLKHVLGDADCCANHKWNFKDMARRVGQKRIAYDVEYAYQCSFAHPDRSIRTLVSAEHGCLVTAPEYGELLFLNCCELNLRDCVRTLDIMRRFLSLENMTGVAEWSRVTDERIRAALDWYGAIRTRFGEENAAQQ